MVGALAQRVGWQGGLMIAFTAKAAAVMLPVFSLALLSQSVSSFMVGAMIPGIVALTSGRLAELVGPLAVPGDLVVCLGAGTITHWANQLPAALDRLAAQRDAVARSGQ